MSGMLMAAAAWQSLDRYARRLLDGANGAWVNVATDWARFQDAAGTTLATADGNPIGLVYDTKNGVPVLGSPISLLATTAQKTADGTTTVNILATDSYAYKFVRVSFSVSSIVGAFTVSSTGTNGTSVTINSAGAKDIVVALGASGGYLKFEGLTTSRFDCSGIVVKELAGNHALQQTTTARPLYKLSPKRGQLDIVDDALQVHTPSAITGSFAFAGKDGVIMGTLAIPAGVFQFPPAPNYKMLESINQLFFVNRALSADEKSKLYDMICAAGSDGDFRTRTSMSNMLRVSGANTYLTSVDASNWDTSSVTSFYFFASNCSSLTTLDVSNWDTSSVTNFVYFVNGCSSLTALDVSNWDTSSVTNFYHFANGCSSLTALDVSNWDTSSVTNFDRFVSGCSPLTTLDVSNWGTGSVTHFNHFASFCSSLTTLDVSNWDTSSVTNFDSFAFGCSSLTALDVSNWDTSSVTNFVYFAFGCSSLTILDVSNWDTSSVTDFQYFTYGCSSLTTLDVSNWDTSSVTKFSYFTTECPSLTTLDVSNWDTSSVTSFEAFVRDCSTLVTLTVGSAFSNSPCLNYGSAFDRCALNVASVDAILASINAAGTSNGTLGLQGANNAIPTGGAANSNVVALRARGWTISNTKGW